MITKHDKSNTKSYVFETTHSVIYLASWIFRANRVLFGPSLLGDTTKCGVRFGLGSSSVGSVLA